MRMVRRVRGGGGGGPSGVADCRPPASGRRRWSEEGEGREGREGVESIQLVVVLRRKREITKASPEGRKKAISCEVSEQWALSLSLSLSRRSQVSLCSLKTDISRSH